MVVIVWWIERRKENQIGVPILKTLEERKV
jgi:hypothetical protein